VLEVTPFSVKSDFGFDFDTLRLLFRPHPTNKPTDRHAKSESFEFYDGKEGRNWLHGRICKIK
jgi:hypothetical protein